jgi:hypothetical protein
MRVIPQHEVLEKLAAIQRADALGRQFAQDQAMEKLASMAGVFMAQAQSKEGLEKLAQAMVYAGELSYEEYEMLKEAGWGSGLKAIGGGIRRFVTRAPATAARGASRDVAAVTKPSLIKRVKGLVSRKPKAVVSKGSRDVASVSKPLTGKEFNRQSSRVAQPKVAPGGATPGKVAPAPAAAPGRTTRSGATNPPAPAASPGSVAPAPASAAPTSSTAAYKKGVGWGRALPYMAAGGLGYGLYKGVPWAARQLEATSTTPMASNAGWSPVSYGYGNSPYGPGVATMGGGA